MEQSKLALLAKLLLKDYKDRIATREKLYRKVAESIQGKLQRGELPKDYKMDRLTAEEEKGNVQNWIIRVRKAQLQVVLALLKGEPYIPDSVTGRFPRYNRKAGL